MPNAVNKPEKKERWCMDWKRRIRRKKVQIVKGNNKVISISDRKEIKEKECLRHDSIRKLKLMFLLVEIFSNILKTRKLINPT